MPKFGFRKGKFVDQNLADANVCSSETPHQFSVLLINSFGFTQINSLLMQMPSGAAQIFFLALTSAVATYVRGTRIAMMVLNTSVSLLGMLLVWQLDESHRTGRVVGLSLAAAFGANVPLALSLISSNVAGFTKRSVTGSLMFVAYCLGNIVGPQFFFEYEAPDYPVCSAHPSSPPLPSSRVLASRGLAAGLASVSIDC